MRAHLDLVGASGAAYRFRWAPELSSLPAEGGNYAFVKEADDVTLIYLGVAETLQGAELRWEEARTKHNAEAIYVRLNIARALREHEHQDLVSHRRMPMSQSSTTL